jgi:hypothetical protein
VAACPACGKELPGEFPFCPHCGAPLTGEAPASALEERKVVSVLFCDLVGFAAASEQADPEDVRDWTTIQHPGSLKTRESGTSPYVHLSASASNNVWTSKLDHWNGLNWTAAQDPNRGPFDLGPNDVAAVSSSDAWAVGNDILDRWDGRAWHAVPSPVRHFELWQLSVVSPTDVWAVGAALGPTEKWTTARPLIERWHGGRSTVKAIDNPPFRSGLSIAALSPDDVWIVGGQSRLGPGNRQLDHWNGKHWTATPLAPNTGVNDFKRIDGQAWAVIQNVTGQGVIRELTACA